MKMNTNRMIELGLVFFITILSFTIGTFVGKKYSDNQHRLAVLEPNKKTAASTEHGEPIVTAETEKQTQTPGQDSEITDADVAKLAEEFSNNSEAAAQESVAPDSEHGTEHTAVNPAVKQKSKDIKEISAKEANPERDLATISTNDSVKPIAKKNQVTQQLAVKQNLKTTTQEAHHEEDAVDTVASKSRSASFNYTVQIGSYPSEAEASKATESLIARGYKATAVPADVNGKIWYRVQVGLFKTLSEAQDYKKDLMEKNRLTSAIVQKISK